MSCPDFDTLMMLLDGELQGRKLKEVSEHVVSCSRCRGLIDSQKMLEASWRDSFVIPDNEKFRSMEWNIFRRLNRRSRWKTFVPAVAAIIVVLLGVKLILNDRPLLNSITDFSRDDQVDYMSDADRFRTESLTPADLRPDSETAMVRGTVGEYNGQYASTGDVSAEITSEMEGYSLPDGEPVLSQPVAEDEYPGEPLGIISSFDQEGDRQTIVGGIATGSTSRSGGSAGRSEYEEEFEESEIAFETVFMDDAVEDMCQEEMIDETCEITLSLDTTGLATAQTVPSVISDFDEAQDNRVSPQSSEYYSCFHETSDHGMDHWKTDIPVELVFDADGQPDSITALLLDSLFAGWSDYISFGYRDTVVVIPLADIQQLFENGSTVPAETIE